MRVTQGTFSFLPDLSEEQIAAQLAYALAQGWALSIRAHARAPPARGVLGDVGPPGLRFHRPRPRAPRDSGPAGLPTPTTT